MTSHHEQAVPVNETPWLTFCRFFERRALWLLLAFLAIFILTTLALSRLHPLWHDELFTHYISTQPALADVFRALAQGVDLQPPLSHLLYRATWTLVGDSPLLRLPGILASATFLLCLYFFAARRVPPSLALIAALIPVHSTVPTYARDVRPYALMLGLTGIALVAWQRAIPAHRLRWLWTFVLWLSLALALFNHYFAILVVALLAMAELIRTWESRSFNYPVWLALAASTTSLLWLFLNWASLHRYAGTFWARGFMHVVEAYAHWTALFLLLVFLALLLLVPRVIQEDREPSASVPLSELALATGFFLLHGAGYLMVKIIKSGYVDRYSIPAVVGLSLLITYWLATEVRPGLQLRTLLASAALLISLGALWVDYTRVKGSPTGQEKWSTLLPLHQRYPDLPLLFSGPIAFSQAAYYAPPSVRPYLLLTPNPNKALAGLGFDTADIAIRELGQIHPDVHIADLDQFLATHPRFLFLLNRDPQWTFNELLERRFCLTAIPHPIPDGTVYLAEPCPAR